MLILDRKVLKLLLCALVGVLNTYTEAMRAMRARYIYVVIVCVLQEGRRRTVDYIGDVYEAFCCDCAIFDLLRERGLTYTQLSSYIRYCVASISYYSFYIHYCIYLIYMMLQSYAFCPILPNLYMI